MSRQIEDPMLPVPVPVQAPAHEGMIEVEGGRLYYWDTGGDGPTVVFMHPATGSAHMWLYQQPVFAAAGVRAIAFSRRGHRGSTPVDPQNPGHGSEDLHQVVTHLGIERFHAIACAAGGAITVDYAHSHPERLASVTLSSSVGGVQDPSYLALSESLRPKGFDAMPADFRELGPSYRAANPEGVQRWLALEHAAITGHRLGQTPVNRITWTSLETLRVPFLLMTGDADLWLPPPALRLYARHIPDNELVIVPEAGHSIHWERPALFNATVLDYVKRHS
jgi:pimeloyl-ACP methyl ester carboxylesterase